jgi:hypothetical protein
MSVAKLLEDDFAAEFFDGGFEGGGCDSGESCVGFGPLAAPVG